MSKHPRKKKSHNDSHRSAEKRQNERGIYAAILMVGIFGLGLWYLASDTTFPHAVIGFLLAVFGLVNWSALQAVRGQELAGWQKALARLPLQFAGYGTTGGKPVEAARGQENAKMVLMVSASLCLVVLIALSWLLLPELRS
jgi:hypothetical protein